MRTVIIYESVYGNTRNVAEELAEVARSHGDVELFTPAVAPADALHGADLVLIGGPTHIHGMSWAATRQSGLAAPPVTGHHEAGADVPGPGLRNWFHGVGRVDGVLAAAFDTRLEGIEVVTGRASLGISRRLRHHGFTEVAAPRSFIVGRDNVLCVGETDRAREWATSVFDSLPALAFQ